MEENQNNEVVTPVTVKQPAGFYLTWQKVLVGFLLFLAVFGVGMFGGMVGSRAAFGRMMNFNQPGQYQQFQGNKTNGMMGGNNQPGQYQQNQGGGRGGMMQGNNQPGQYQQYPNTGNYSCP